MNKLNYLQVPNRVFSLNFIPFLLFFVLLLVQACSKDPGGEPIVAAGNGLVAGECRFKTQADSAQYSYDNQNRITQLANYAYSYFANKVVLKDTKVDKVMITFNLKENNFPANMEVMGLTDTIAQELQWFIYNADSSLALSRSFILVKDKYVFNGKQVYTWTNKNLTRVVAYGKDSVNAMAIINMAYDTSKIDKRKPIFEKLLAHEPNFAFTYMPKSGSKNLLKDLQLIVTGNPAAYYQVYHYSDAKGNILREAMRIQGGAEVFNINYTYECKN